MNPRPLGMVSVIDKDSMNDYMFDNNGNESVQMDDISSDHGSASTDELQHIDNQEIDCSAILEPGTNIKPKVNENVALKLAERLYGIVATEIGELNSYDDKNYLIIADRNIKNPIIPNNWPHGYVIKIQNSFDSRKTKFIDAQTQLMLFLGQQNIDCPKPVMNIYGKYFSIERILNAKHAVRLLQFQPGKIFHDVLKTNHLYYQVGEFLAKIDNALKNFKHEAFDTYRSLWHLESTMKLNEFLYVIKDEERKGIVEQVVEQFDKKILQNLDQFDSGMIHGDFNEQNIIVNKTDKPNEYRVTGVIDFGDASYSKYLFELAICMAYMMLQGGDISAGGLVMAGYGMVRPIPEHEKQVLKVVIAARLCQSLVLGAYTHTLDPKNDYILTTQIAGWELLTSIWAETDEALIELWSSTADNYLKQSYK